MRQFLTIVAVIISSFCQAQTNWEKLMLDSAVSISFPSKPNQVVNKAVKTFTLRQADSTANYIVSVIDMFASTGIDATTLQAAMEEDEFWEQAKNALITSMGVSATLVKEEMTTVQSLKAMLLEIDRKTSKGETNNLSVLIFVNGTNSFNIVFNNRGGKADKSLKDQFFKSIEVNE